MKASVEGTDAGTSITITDDDTETANITLKAGPASISEDAGETEVTITATIDGMAFADDVKLTLVLDTADATATRDVDYTAIIRSVEIPAEAVEGSTTISITRWTMGTPTGTSSFT